MGFAERLQSGGSLAVRLAAAAEALKTVLRVFKPAVVLAASNWQNALPAGIAARELGLPFAYEVRGFWEISRASREPEWGAGPEFEAVVAHETAVARGADRVFTLNRLMRQELLRRGVKEARVALVPNGIDAAAIEVGPAPRVGVPTRADLGLTSRYVVGYVGSFNEYEGLEALIRAVAALRRRGVDLSLLLVGASHKTGLSAPDAKAPLETAYRELARSHGLADEHLQMPGRLAPEAATACYNLLDLVVLPRRPLAVCELVTPMKPLEALAHGKPVLLSDVAPLADLAEISPQFHYFRKGDEADLANQVARLLQNPTPIAPPTPELLQTLSWPNRVKPIAQWVQENSGGRSLAGLAARAEFAGAGN
ncbi:glycosyltransferase [Desulfurivibrio alkaliphilus]|uniref:glycosyltransferase n=1 Tax=Desulfurivibrio alkaliphilus TaxID=427923 RepID=UPI0001B3F106|nr:glycosyltransferase [Desulfurivibrio alkaliphilus]